MAVKTYLPDSSGIAREIKKLYIGDANNIAREIKLLYAGDANNKARLIFQKKPEIVFNGQWAASTMPSSASWCSVT